MIIRIVDKWEDDVFETWYKICDNTDNPKSHITYLLYMAYEEYDNCEHDISVYEIFEKMLDERGIYYYELTPDMVFEIEDSIQRMW